jgi:hypothetical protein
VVLTVDTNSFEGKYNQKPLNHTHDLRDEISGEGGNAEER